LLIGEGIPDVFGSNVGEAMATVDSLWASSSSRSPASLPPALVALFPAIERSP
jgi:hypothetical protein